MDTSKFDTRIKDLDGEIDVLRNRMEETCKEFLGATEEFIKAWFKDSVDHAVKSHPDITKKSGVERLRNLKSDRQEKIAMVPDIVGKHVNRDQYWAHRGQLTEPEFPFSAYDIHGQFGKLLHDGVRESLGYVGAILVKYGFADTGEHGEWENRPGDISKYDDYKPPRYRYGYDWSEEMKDVLKRYSDLYDKLRELDKELKKVEREKAEAEAKNLWDQV